MKAYRIGRQPRLVGIARDLARRWTMEATSMHRLIEDLKGRGEIDEREYRILDRARAAAPISINHYFPLKVGDLLREEALKGSSNDDKESTG